MGIFLPAWSRFGGNLCHFTKLQWSGRSSLWSSRFRAHEGKDAHATDIAMCIMVVNSVKLNLFFTITSTSADCRDPKRSPILVS